MSISTGAQAITPTNRSSLTTALARLSKLFINFEQIRYAMQIADSPLAPIIPELERLVPKYRIRKLHVFGSMAEGKFKESSDIDLLVSFHDMPLLEFADNYFDLLEELETILGRKVDLVVDKSIHNPYLAASVQQSKVLLYE